MSRYKLEKELNDRTNLLLGDKIEDVRVLFEKSFNLFEYQDELFWHKEEGRYTILSEIQKQWVMFKLGYLAAKDHASV